MLLLSFASSARKGVSAPSLPLASATLKNIFENLLTLRIVNTSLLTEGGFYLICQLWCTFG